MILVELNFVKNFKDLYRIFRWHDICNILYRINRRFGYGKFINVGEIVVQISGEGVSGGEEGAYPAGIAFVADLQLAG
ncbi:MAG: hypothetical protein Kow00108_18740 [Calditrichia bacterium]